MKIAIEIVDLATNSMVIFNSFLYVYQRVKIGWLENQGDHWLQLMHLARIELENLTASDI